MKLYKTTCRLRSSLIAVLSVFWAASFLTGAPLEPGSAFPALENMQDQHELAYAMPVGVQHVAVAFTMSVGKSANKALAEKGANYLPEKNAVFIANIDGMPAIGRFFAMPKMRKYPHRIMLADADGLLDDFPERENQVTIFDLDASGEIVTVSYWNPEFAEIPF
ncbi:hypothetical protein ACWPKO_08505 [Coraliomargarita sp. W4R53]